MLVCCIKTFGKNAQEFGISKSLTAKEQVWYDFDDKTISDTFNSIFMFEAASNVELLENNFHCNVLDALHTYIRA